MTKNTTRDQVDELADAMWQLLDDMANGVCVSPLAKAKARLAWEPFKASEEDAQGLISLEAAKAIVERCSQ